LATTHAAHHRTSGPVLRSGGCVVLCSVEFARTLVSSHQTSESRLHSRPSAASGLRRGGGGGAGGRRRRALPSFRPACLHRNLPTDISYQRASRNFSPQPMQLHSSSSSISSVVLPSPPFHKTQLTFFGDRALL